MATTKHFSQGMLPGEMHGHYQAFLPRNVSRKDAWPLPSISRKDVFLKKCIAAMKHFSLRMFPLEVYLAVARRLSSRMFPGDKLGAHLVFLPRNIFRKDTWCPPIVSPMDCFLKGCLATTRCFSHGLFPTEIFVNC